MKLCRRQELSAVDCRLDTQLTRHTLQLLQEIEQKAAQSQQQIAIVKAQIAGKAREDRMIQLTTKELSGLPKPTKVYEGVGRM